MFKKSPKYNTGGVFVNSMAKYAIIWEKCSLLEMLKNTGFAKNRNQSKVSSHTNCCESKKAAVMNMVSG